MNETNKSRPGLKELRKKAGLTQFDVAIQTNVRERAVRDWENKGAIPGFDKAVLLAIALKVPLPILAKEFGLNIDGLLECVEPMTATEP